MVCSRGTKNKLNRKDDVIKWSNFGKQPGVPNTSSLSLISSFFFIQKFLLDRDKYLKLDKQFSLSLIWDTDMPWLFRNFIPIFKYLGFHREKTLIHINKNLGLRNKNSWNKEFILIVPCFNNPLKSPIGTLAFKLFFRKKKKLL